MNDELDAVGLDRQLHLFKVWRDDYYLIPSGFLQPPVLIQAG